MEEHPDLLHTGWPAALMVLLHGDGVTSRAAGSAAAAQSSSSGASLPETL